MGKVYVVPFLMYLLGTNAASRFEGTSYAIAYAVVVCIVAGYLAYCYTDWKDSLKPALPSPSERKSSPSRKTKTWQRILVGGLVGIIGIILWIAICELSLEKKLFEFFPSWLRPSERVGFNPFEEFAGSGTFVIWSFITVRMFGLAVVVPVMEELFWRGFLIRWFIDSEWRNVPIGTYSLSSSAMITLLFTLAHPELIAAAVYCVLINALLYRTRDLLQCIVAHAASNFALGIYVLQTGTWELW